MTCVAIKQCEACWLPEPKLACRFGLLFIGSGDGSLSNGGYKHGRIRCANRDASLISSLLTEIDATIITTNDTSTFLNGFQIIWYTAVPAAVASIARLASSDVT